MGRRGVTATGVRSSNRPARPMAALVLGSFLVTACTAQPALVTSPPPGPPTATPSIHFITTASPEEIEEEMRLAPTVPGEIRLRTYMTAKALGELTLVNGCLYIQAIDAPNRQLLIWPPEFYALDEREGAARILDATSGEELVRVGDHIRIGGGQVAYEHLSDRVRAQLSADCPGPYWIVGLGVERWEPTPTVPPVPYRRPSRASIWRLASDGAGEPEVVVEAGFLIDVVPQWG